MRQPIISVMGHVDHGKTSFLDNIRGTTICKKEAGSITQHIGVTEVPASVIKNICNVPKLKIPGLLFIDTPGHSSFTSLRTRGGSIADLVILVIDIEEGLMPQTIESINILKKYKTPFIILANKIDRTYGWKSKTQSFEETFSLQKKSVKDALMQKIYSLIEKLYDRGFNADLYSNISDFSNTIAIIPTSAKQNIGTKEVLMILVGLSQKFLEKRLDAEGEGKATVLEVKEEKGMGITLNIILYQGEIKKGDTIVIGSRKKPIITTVKGIFKPHELTEMKLAGKFKNVEKVKAAAGIKITASNLEDVVAGVPLLVTKNIEKAMERISCEMPHIETSEEGAIMKADTIGSLEALTFELKDICSIKKVEIGPVSRKEVIEASTSSDPLHKIIFAFNVPILPDAQEEISKSDVKIIQSDVIYQQKEEYEKWKETIKKIQEKDDRESIIFPGKMKILEDHIFRIAKPAIVGVRVLGGRIRVQQKILRSDGKTVSTIKSIRTGEQSIKEAKAGEEVAIALDKITIGRQLKAGDIIYIDIPEKDAKSLRNRELTFDEKEILEEITNIKKKENSFWSL